MADIISLGCRLNIAESETIRAMLGNRDTVVVNSCAVTNEAVRRTRQAIRRARRDRPDSEIVVTGCAAQIDADSFATMPEVNRVIGNADKLLPAVWASEEAVVVSDIMRVAETAPHLAASFSEHARAFVEVQNGCDHRCTFCAIPYGRGNSRSVPAGSVIERIAGLVDAGHREVVLTGVDLTSYGPDLPGTPTLGQLVERILRHVPKLERLRLSSLDSIEIDDRLFGLITGEARILPHVHLSLQAGDDMILKRMKRRHLRGDAIEFTSRVRAARPEIVFGADIITGFPTETDEMFANSIKLVEECDLTWLHVFPYSEREGTPAAKIPNKVPKAVRKERAAELRAAGDKRVAALFKASEGKTANVLIERVGHDGEAMGHSEQFIPVIVNSVDVEPGQIVPVRLAARDENAMTGIKLD